MTAYPGQRYLFDIKANDLVEAEIFDEISKSDIEDWKGKWKPQISRIIKELRQRGVPPHLWPQSFHWDWESKAPSTGVIYEKGYALRCQGHLQGLMVVDSVSGRCRAPDQSGANCLYVKFIESAPWNQARYTNDPIYSLVGSVLIAAAIHQSMDEGFNGRFALHSLPQSDEWYRDRLGMIDFGLDPDRYRGRLKYFEATKEIAEKILNGVNSP